MGKIVASFLAAKFGLLHYLHLESVKKAALRKAKGDYDSVRSPQLKAVFFHPEMFPKTNQWQTRRAAVK